MLRKSIIGAQKTALFNKMPVRNFGAIQKYAQDEQLIANQDKRYLAFNRLPATNNAVWHMDNLYRHHNDLPLTK